MPREHFRPVITMRLEPEYAVLIAGIGKRIAKGIVLLAMIDQAADRIRQFRCRFMLSDLCILGRSLTRRGRCI